MGDDTKYRDSMAKHRTHLANERTLLAYWRTALALLLGGGVLIRLDQSADGKLLSTGLIILGIGVIIYGIYRYITYKKKI